MVEVLVLQVIEVNCVRLGVLLLAKLNLLCLEMLIKAGCDLFWSLTNSELNCYKTRNLLLKILDLSLSSQSTQRNLTNLLATRTSNLNNNKETIQFKSKFNYAAVEYS